MNNPAKSAIDAIVINGGDNIAVCLRDLEGPETIRVMKEGGIIPFRINGPVPLGHKIALHDIIEGGEVLKYSEAIGRVTAPVRAGDHVHTHNMTD